MKKRVEVLAPAGSMESMMAAVNAGADAVYMGGSRFGARAYADNPGEDRFLEAIDYAHLHRCRLYMTVNTLVKESELHSLYEFLVPYVARGLDAVIVQDMGVFAMIRKYFPGLPVHASTQMTVTNWRSAALLKEQGAARVVTARELSLREIAEIREHVEIEIESFVHGALCYCYSGQCLMSSLIGGRSGNRGRCAQPCRLPYEVAGDGRAGKISAKPGRKGAPEPYLLSMKDLCTLDILPDIIEAGVDSLKIEGRMKSPRYTAGVVSVYRRYVDRYLEDGRSGYEVNPADRRLLLELFDRGGQTDGYYKRHNGREMVVRKEKPAHREPDAALFERLDREYVRARKQEPVRGRVTVAEGEPVRLELAAGADLMAAVRAGTGQPVKGAAEAGTGQAMKCVSEAGTGQTAAGVRQTVTCVSDEPVQSAQSRPLTQDQLLRQMKKTGNSPFYFETLETEIRGNCFVPVQTLNELRREGLRMLEDAVLAPYRRTAPQPWEDAAVRSPHRSGEKSWRLHVSLEEPSALQAALDAPDVDEIYLDANGFGAELWVDAVGRCHREGKACALLLPNIFRREAEHYLTEHIRTLRAAGFDEFILRSMEEIPFLLEQGIGAERMASDANLYAMNHLAAEWFAGLGVSRLTLPVEANERELKNLTAVCANEWELVAYGYLPAMISAQCIVRTTKGCTKKPELLSLRDRTGKVLPVRNCCRFCYNTIYNPSPLSLLGMEQAVREIAPSVLRLSFTVETPEQTAAVIAAYADHFRYGGESPAPYWDFTRGHMKRGVE